MTDAARLRAIPLFADLRPSELLRISELLVREHWDAGARVFAEGEPGDRMYLIVEGKVRISRTLPGMGEEALAILGPGAVFGEMAVLDGAPRSADAVVHEASELLVLDRAAMESLFARDLELAHHVLSAMLRTVVGRLRDMNDKLGTVFMMTRFC